MRKDEIELLDSIDKLTVNQFYLLELPKTPQQTFLHLYAHRVLVQRAMFNKNLDRLRTLLQGSFANTSLNIALVTSYIDNQIDFTQEEEWLVEIVHNWVNFYPTIRSATREKYMLCKLVMQDVLDLKTVKGFSHFLAYLNIISVDVWKIIRNKKNQQEFLGLRPVKEELKEMMLDKVGARLDAADLLDFVSGCIPKTLLNILLSNESLPSQVKKKVKQLECLFANQGVEYFLKKHVKLSLLLKQILLILLTMDMPTSLLQRLMLLAMRYYCVYHFDKKYSAPEIVIHAYNRLTDDVRRSLNDEFTLFFKIIQKLGKNKFIDFIADNSPFAKRIIEVVKKKPLIAYPQQGANPYNTFGVSEQINIERGATAYRYFQILEDFSIFYFRIDVPYYDITVKLYYLGEIASTKIVKTLLFTHEKTVGELKNSVNAIKRGLYMFQFDNSYSWLNSKKVYYQNEIFTPLQLKVTNADEWIDQFYGNVYLNQIASDEDILVVQYKKPQEKQAVLQGIFIERENGFLRLRMGKKGGQYVYETDNVERMMQRAEEYFHAKEKYQWHINKSPINDLTDIDNFLRGIQAPSTVAKEEKPEKKKEQISLQEYKDDQQEQNQPEYEVVQRQEMQRSQILNESPAPKPSSQHDLSSKDPKEVINCSFQQTSQIYES